MKLNFFHFVENNDPEAIPLDIHYDELIYFSVLLSSSQPNRNNLQIFILASYFWVGRLIIQALNFISRF